MLISWKQKAFAEDLSASSLRPVFSLETKSREEEFNLPWIDKTMKRQETPIKKIQQSEESISVSSKG